MKAVLSVLLLLALLTPNIVIASRRTQDPTKGQSSSAPLTNKDVLDMLKVGLPADIVVAKIDGSVCNFDTSPAALAELKSANVPDPVILAMVKAVGRVTPGQPLANTSLVGPGVVVADGTPLTVITLEEISSKTASEGDALTFKVADDVVVDGQVVIAKGTIAKGTVSEVEKSGRMGKGGKLGIRLDQTSTVDNQTIKLRASKGKEGDDKTGTVIALTLFLSPLFLLKRGSNAKVKPGTKINAYTDEERRVVTASQSK